MKKWIFVAACLGLSCGSQTEPPVERGTTSTPATGTAQPEDAEPEPSATAMSDARRLLTRFT